ncbi:MAG: hypothetical protein CMJ75_04860 [Planctomycetaceae bacterium]|nr:hypothetical protein [Planctomycetaceae bacterium]
MRHCFSYGLFALVLAGQGALDSQAQERDTFDQAVAPILANRCLECHRGADAQGGLDLSQQGKALRGGESGPAWRAGKPLESLLWERVANGEMPPKKPLPENEREVLRKWIADGAAWGTDTIDPFRFTTESRAGTDWWSLQPLRDSQVPVVRNRDRVRNPVDAFVLARLESAELGFAEDAAPRQLIRRVYLDLIGLPPTPAEVAAFVEDPSDAAYGEMVDRLLKSKHYGERWGRHWLDVARFGESDGFERNGPRNHLWHYRDWVIDAFNADMPYDEFARLQIAGDVLRNNSPTGLAAAGFWVAGVHNTVVGGSEFMKRVAREDELEEMVGALGQTFVGLTFNCSRCHDHKFDPIRQREYYRLTAAISGVRHGEKEAVETRFHEQIEILEQELKTLNPMIAGLETKARKAVLAARKTKGKKPATPPKPYAQWEFESDLQDSLGELHGKAYGSARIENGGLVLDQQSYVETAALPIGVKEKTLEAWVLLANLKQRGGSALTLQTKSGVIFDAIVFGEREAGQWMAGSNGFVRTKSFVAPVESKADKEPVHFAIVYRADGSITGYRNGTLYGKSYKSSGLQSYQAGDSTVLFGLRHKPAGGPNRNLAGRILRAQLHLTALSPAAVAASAGVESDYVAEEELVAALSPTERSRRQEFLTRRASLLQRTAELRSKSKVKFYTVAPGNPGTTYFLTRGDVMKRGEVMTPGAVSAVRGVTADFGLAADASDADRRVRLAAWITSDKNPLFPRVMVNRLWHYHFGTGIVETPNDFGFNGGRPSHPRLLDWLAITLRQADYRLKAVHKVIVTSTAYRQGSKFRPAAHRRDAGNRLLWRKSPQRVEAEVLRDSILAVAGKLNLQAGGPGFVDVSITPNNGTTYYEPIDKEDEQLHRRTVYRFWPRGGRSALLDTFDCPDPSSTAPRRTVTTTPLQALSLLNNSFVLRMAGHLGARARREAGAGAAHQVRRIYELTLSRQPDAEEAKLAVQLVERHGAAALSRALFNSNEFVVSQ